MHIPTGYAQVNLLLAGDALPNGGEVTFGVDNQSADYTAATCATLIEADLAGAQDIWDTTRNKVEVVGIKVKLGPNETGPMAILATSIVGDNSSPEVLPNVAYLLRKNTAAGGRKGRGRLYWPGVSISDVTDGGVITSGIVTEQQAGWNAFIAALETSQLDMVLLHAESPTTPFKVTSMTCDAKIATQRRRLRR